MGQHRRFLSGMSVVLLLAVLSGCQREDEPARLNFDTDPRILRGVWTGESEAGKVLRLEAQAHDPSDSGYAVTGTFTLADAEPVAFSGYMYQPLKPTSGAPRPQTSYPSPFTAESEDGRWRFEGSSPAGSPPRFGGFFSGPETEDGFVMTREADRLPLPEDDDAPIATDKERYTPEDFGDYVRYTIKATYTNPTEKSVYLAPCGFEPPDYRLQRFTDNAWQASDYATVCAGVGGVPATEIQPDESFTVTLTLDAFRSANVFPQLGIDLVPGVHRFNFSIVASVDDAGVADNDLLPLEQRVSNAFELEAP